ncbi:glycosyltransferase family 39 protein [bacterium]|nr:glycosyltransferase family 39 protein [bacterium]MBU1991145.1 glycosyltransferase family 39 protein [bacterium]
MLELLHKTPKKSAYAIIVFLAVFSTIYNSYLPLHGDEAYYWMWSHHLQTGYYDHPPMIAYMLYLTNFISQSEWGVRLTNVISMSIAALYIFKLASEMFDEEIALNSIIIFTSVILVHAGYIITTPDSPLILFFTLALYYSYKALFHGRRKDYLLTGIMLGLMMLSKYTAILFVPIILLFILVKRRDILLNPNFYLASLLTILIISPMLFWNYQHDWISFTFQLEHGSTKSFEIYPGMMLEFFAGQFGIFSPVFTAVLFYYLVKEKLFVRDDKLFFLSLSVAVILLFFLYKGLYTRMALNYTAPAYVGGAILSAYIFTHYRLVKTFKIALMIAITFTLMGRIGFMFYLEVVQDRMYGNKEAVKLLQKYVKEEDRLYGDHLTMAAYLKYYLKGHPDTDVVPQSRFSQYDMWRKDDYLQDGLVLTRDPEHIRLSELYKEVKLLETLTVKKGLHGEKTLYIYRVGDVK